METMSRTFELDKNILQNLDKIVPIESQSKYVEELFAKILYEQNQQQVEDIIWNFAQEMPKDAQTGVEIIRQMRDGDNRV